MDNVLVLGGGVLGLSSAITFKLAGANVTVLSDKFLDDIDAAEKPIFASAYPAASIIPHSVNVENVQGLLRDSKSIFETLSGFKVTGVRTQKHFEVFENNFELPPYSQQLDKFTICNDGTVPIRRKDALSVSGYSFECFFCDMPIYTKWLIATVHALGVKLKRKRLVRSDLEKGSWDLVINCLGAGSHTVFEDIEPGVFVKGVLLLTNYKKPKNNFPISYNYTPSSKVHSNGDGTAADIYFYPRKYDCVLGGTRELGFQTVDNRFVSQSPQKNRTISINGIEFPEALLELNKHLLNQIGVSIEPPHAALVGFRHMHIATSSSEPQAIVRRMHRVGLPPIIDCFGFGGAGVTLSWGAVLRSYKLAKDILKHSTLTPHDLTNKLIESSF